MTAKEYLSQIRTLDVKINQRIEERERLWQDALGVSGIRYDKDKVQSSNALDTTALVIRCYEMEAEINAMIDRLIDLKHDIIGDIHKLTDHRYIQLLHLRYVDFKRLEDVACIMRKTNGDEYSYDHIVWLHGEALQALAEIIPENLQKSL